MNPFVTPDTGHRNSAYLPTYPTPIPIHNPIVPNHPLLFCGFAAKKVDGKNNDYEPNVIVIFEGTEGKEE